MRAGENCVAMFDPTSGSSPYRCHRGIRDPAQGRGTGGHRRDVLLVDGVRSVDWIHKVRRVIGDKPLLFNQIAGGKSPRLSLTELEDLGINVAIYSTPCLFAAQAAIENALLELRANDGRLPEVKDGDVGVTASTELLERNISRTIRAAPQTRTAFTKPVSLLGRAI